MDARITAEETLHRMMDSYGEGVLRMCYLQLRDTMLAEDAAQDTFFKAYQKLDGFRGDCSEKTWLIRIAINTCRDYQRRAWLKRMDRSVDVETLVLPGEPVEAADDTVIRAVMALPPRSREVVLLRYYQEMQLEEISRVLGIPQGTVTSRLNRARSKLRRQLEGWYFDEEF